MRSPTLMMLMVEHDYKATLTVEEVGARYWNWTKAHSRRMAAEGRFPVPCFQISDSRKAPYHVLLGDLAQYLDNVRAQAINDQRAPVYEYHDQCPEL